MSDSPSRRSDNDEPQERKTSVSDHVDVIVSLNKSDCEHQQASFQKNDIITPEKKHADVRSSTSSELLVCKEVTPPVPEKKRQQSKVFTSTINTDDKKNNTNPSTQKTFTNAKTKILHFDSLDKKLKTNHTDNTNTRIGKDRDQEEVNTNRYHNKQRPATEYYTSHHHHHSYLTQYHHPGSSNVTPAYTHSYPYHSHHSSHPEYNTTYDMPHTFHPGPSNNHDHINYSTSKNYNNYHSHPSSHQHHHAYPSSSYHTYKNETSYYNHYHQYNYNHGSSYHDSSFSSSPYPCQQAFNTSCNLSYNKNRPSLHQHPYHYQPSYYEHTHSSHDQHPEMRQTKNTKLNLMEAPSRHAPTPPRLSRSIQDNKLTGEIPESITIQKQTTTQPDDDDDDDGLTFSSSFSTALLPRNSKEHTTSSSNKNLIPSVSYYDQTSSSSSERESPTKKCDSLVDVEHNILNQGESSSILFGDGLQSIGTISFDSMLSSSASVAMCFPCNDTPDDTVLPPLPCPSYNNNTASILHQSNMDRNTKRQKLLPTPSTVAVAAAGRKTTSKSCSSSSRPRKECRISGCSNRVVQGGVCIQHGARRKICSFPGCTKHVKKAGRCSTHGPARMRCNMESCTNVAVQGGRCIAHGAKKKKCCIAGCSKQAILSGMCKRHYDQHHIVIQRHPSPCEVFSSEGVNQGDVKEYGDDSRCYQDYPSQKEDKIYSHCSEFGYI